MLLLQGDFTFSDKLVILHCKEDWSEDKDRWVHEGRAGLSVLGAHARPQKTHLTAPLLQWGHAECTPLPAFEYLLTSMSLAS